MKFEIITAKNHDEWLKAREGGIGSSEVATILGVNAYDTPYKLWLRKTGRVKVEEKDSFLMKAGHYFESAVAQFCADETGVDIVKNSAAEFVVIDKEKPFLRVSPDRFGYLPNSKHTNENKVIVECKTTQNDIDADDLPKYWFVQLMYQLGVCRIPQGYLAWLIKARTFGTKNIKFDKDFYNDVIVAEVERFWKDCVIGDQEPALVNVDDVITKYPTHLIGKSIDATDELIEKWNTLKEVNAEVKRLSEIKKETEAEIKMLMQDAESVVIPATRETPQKILATWKAPSPSEKFALDEFMNENPEMYAKYLRTEQGGRRFLLK